MAALAMRAFALLRLRGVEHPVRFVVNLFFFLLLSILSFYIIFPFSVWRLASPPGCGLDAGAWLMKRAVCPFGCLL